METLDLIASGLSGVMLATIIAYHVSRARVRKSRLLSVLRGLDARLGFNHYPSESGICHYVENQLKWAFDDRRTYEYVKRMQDLWVDWDRYSGYPSLPVKERRGVDYGTATRYQRWGSGHQYGRDRRDLVKYLIWRLEGGKGTYERVL